jgi:MFS family permease
MSIDFSQGVSGLGVLSSSFYLGVAISQVPGGILAAKVGPKKTAVIGTFLYSASALVAGLSPAFLQVAALRFLVGVGMSFVFAPGVTLVAKYYKRGSEGLGVGLYNSAFDIGGAIGIFGWAVLAEIIGWRFSLVASGILGISTGVLLFLAVPKDPLDNDLRIQASQLKGILLNEQLIILSVVILGNGTGLALVSSFMVYYLEKTLGAAAGVAGLVGSLVLASPIIFAPIGGRLYDRSRGAKKLLLASGVVTAAGVALVAFGNIFAAVASTVVVGIGGGIGFTVGFSAARETNVTGLQFEALAIAWANSISLFGGFWSPLVFSAVVTGFGYPLAWLTGGIYTLVLSLAALALREKDTTPQTSG